MSGPLTWQGEVKQSGSCTQSVRDALLTDDSGSIPVSTWEEHFDKVESDLFFKFAAMKLRRFNGLGLSTQRFTEIDAYDSFDVTETQTSSVICCPTILNENVNIYPKCNNSLCRKKKLTTTAGAILATCQHVPGSFC